VVIVTEAHPGSELAAETHGIERLRTALIPHKRKRRKPRIDLRSREGRRVTELVRAYRQRIGPDADDPVLSARVRQAAELVALSEALRARALRGDPNVSPDDTIRSARAADMAVRRLRLDERAAPAGPSLSEYLQSKAAGIGKIVEPQSCLDAAPASATTDGEAP
jgi:hypothetical protein